MLEIVAHVLVSLWLVQVVGLITIVLADGMEDNYARWDIEAKDN